MCHVNGIDLIFFLHFIYPCQTHFTSDIRLFHGVFEQCRNSAAHSTFTVNGLVKCERAFVCDSHEKCFHVSVCAVALKTETVSKTDSPATVLGGGARDGDHGTIFHALTLVSVEENLSNGVFRGSAPRTRLTLFW